MKATVLSLLSYIFMMRNSQRLRLYKFRLFPVSEPRNPLSWWTNSVSGCRSKAKCTWNVKTSTETVAVILPKIRAHIFLGEIDWIEQRTSKQTMQWKCFGAWGPVKYRILTKVSTQVSSQWRRKRPVWKYLPTYLPTERKIAKVNVY